MVSPLPSELINEILSRCTNCSLASCALTNKMLLDVARSHLYRHILWDFPWSCTSAIHSIATHPYLISHTRHLTTDFLNSDLSSVYTGLSQLVNGLLAFGKLESLTLLPFSSSNHEKCLRLQALLFRLVPMSSLLWLSLFLDGSTGSPGLIPFISSPKLRDLSLVLDPDAWDEDEGEGEDGAPTSADFVKLNPPLQFLFHSPHHLDLSNIRRLVVDFVQAEVVAEYIVKLFTACNSLTHLTLNFEGLSPDEEDIPALFIPIQPLLSLTSLSIKTYTNMSNIDKTLNQLNFIFKQLPPKAPLRRIILKIPWPSFLSSKLNLESHPSLEALRSILKCRDEPTCELEVGFKDDPD